MPSNAPKKYRFADVELDIGARTLKRGSESIQLNAKAFDLLSYLVCNQGRVLTKEELLSAVWPGQFVEENNLSVQISRLRKIFDRQIISTVSGRGYCFSPEVEIDDEVSEVVIEKRHFSRVVVDSRVEETDTDTPIEPRSGTAGKSVAQSSRLSTRYKVAAAGLTPMTCWSSSIVKRVISG